MITIIAGSRTIDGEIAYEVLCNIMDVIGWTVTKIISGGAKGPDTLGERWAAAHGIPCDRMPANWKVYGSLAGLLRNGEMASVAEACVILWDGESKGTAHMKRIAVKYGLKLHVEELPHPEDWCH